MLQRVRRRGAPAGAAVLAALAFPATASAHGIASGPSLPIPGWLFAWAAALVLVASFVALAVLWPTPRLAAARPRRVASLPRWLEVFAGALGVALFVLVVYAGLAGEQTATDNLAPTFVFVAFWVGVPLVSAVVGDVFRAVSPWRAVARAVAALVARIAPGAADAPPLRYPPRLGYWPAVSGLLAFGWLELVYVNRDQPRTLAVLALGYATVQLVGMALYGIETWTRRADAFGVYFALFARMSPLYVDDRVLYARPPLSGLGPADPVPGTVAVVCVLLGITTFDGLSSGALWTDVAPSLQRALHDAGLGLEPALEVVLTAGLLASVAFVACFYRLCVDGMRSVAPAEHRTAELATGFSHTLVPVALGYVLAHYLTLLLSGSQALGYEISDPLARRGEPPGHRRLAGQLRAPLGRRHLVLPGLLPRRGPRRRTGARARAVPGRLPAPP